MDNCLVTGASGFVGRELCRSLREKKRARVTAVSRNRVEGDWDELIRWDFVDGTMPAEKFAGIDTVFHLAGFTHDYSSGSGIEEIYRKINTATTLDLAEAAAKQGVKRFVFTSSVKAGGSPPQGICADENYPAEPDGIYGRTKRAAEKGLIEIGRKTGMHVSIIRPSLVYGPGVKGNLRMMLGLIRRGWFPPPPETGNIRTMVHRDDLVRALILAAEAEKAAGEIFILTDSHHYSLRRIYDEMCIALGEKVPNWSFPTLCFLVPAWLGDLAGLFFRVPFDSYRYRKMFGDDCYDSTKIQTLLNFKPEKNLADSLPDMVRELRN